MTLKEEEQLTNSEQTNNRNNEIHPFKQLKHIEGIPLNTG